VHVRLSDHDRPGCAQSTHDRGVALRSPVAKRGSARRAREAGEVDVVLDRDRKPGQWSAGRLIELVELVDVDLDLGGSR